jgi:hypothetical protein
MLSRPLRRRNPQRPLNVDPSRPLRELRPLLETQADGPNRPEATPRRALPYVRISRVLGNSITETRKLAAILAADVAG